MNAKSYLKEYAAASDGFLEKFFNRKVREIKEIGTQRAGVKMAVDMIERYRNFSRGGKKLRGALIQLGYEIAGGNKRDVLAASTSIEIIHSFLLMHDDIMDRDSVRRGSPTIHKQYENDQKKLKSSKDPEHYGISMGIDLGDLGSYLAMEVLLSANLESKNTIAAATYLSRLLQRVSYGQALDVAYEQRNKITESDVMEVHLQKTSVYTIGGPLKIGALLGGLSGKKIDYLEKFGEPVGIAFQLRDDELGLYSNERVLGKPIGSDIREGKNTILRIKAVELAKGPDKKFLSSCYGNKDISKKDVRKVQNLTTSTGALKYSQNFSKKLVEEGKKYIPKITSDAYLQRMLTLVANFVIERDS